MTFNWTPLKKLDNTNIELVDSVLYDFESAAKKVGAKKINFENLSKDDIILAIGGDGTALQAMRKAVSVGAKIVAVHAGRLGFLTDFHPKETKQIPQLILNNQIQKDSRWILETTINDQTVYAANEFSLADRFSGQAHWFGFKFKDFNAGRFMADGVVLSTSTGSTAYSLSNGGSIICPEANVAMVSAMSPASLSFRTISVPIEKDNISLECQCRNDSELIIRADGQEANSIKMKKNEKFEFTISRSLNEVTFLRKNEWCFFTALAEKMHWNEQY